MTKLDPSLDPYVIPSAMLATAAGGSSPHDEGVTGPPIVPLLGDRLAHPPQVVKGTWRPAIYST